MPDLQHEQDLWSETDGWVAGLDECGRGPLAGPVVAGAVVLAPDADASAFDGVRDSKRLSPSAIARYAAAIREGAFADGGLIGYGLGAGSVREIDRLNIRRATALAMRRALEQLEGRLVRAGHLSPEATVSGLLVDGTALPEIGRDHVALPGGDDRSLSIACAAILAKDTRDRLMEALAEQHPSFACWASDHGYPSPAHLAALREHGPVAGHHRMTFRPCAQTSFL